MKVGSVTLKAGHVQPVWAGHPWVFAQAIQRIEGGVQPGDEVIVRDARGNALGRGLYSPGSAIPVRLFTRDAERPLGAELINERIRRAAARRAGFGLPSPDTTGFRLLHAEGDDLPGLIVDQLGSIASVQFGTLGMKRREGLVYEALDRVLSPRAIVDRTPARTAESEGFTSTSGVARGDASLSAFEFHERGFAFRIPFELGQKTGFYFDQRPLRTRVEALASGRRVLDAYCYTGSMALAAARGGASEVLAVDTSALALEVAAECAELNGLGGRVQFVCADATQVLAEVGRKGGFDLVICDPPKLAPSRAQKGRAADAMRKIARAGVRATRPGGLLVLCSCSAALGLAELTRALALGARDVGARAIVFERWFQGPDHPVPAAFPEGLYLSTVIAEVEV